MVSMDSTPYAGIPISTWSLNDDLPDRFGVIPSRVMAAATSEGSGYLWVLDDSGTDQFSLARAYAQRVDDTGGRYGYDTPAHGEIIMMADISEVTI